VLYRLSEFVTRYWRHRSRLHLQPVSVALQDVATQAWYLIDWLPARVTALGFAVVGSFEEAIDAWRTYTQSANLGSGGVTNNGVILAATSGAVNVRLGVPWAKEVVSPNASSPDLAQSLGADASAPAAGMPGQEPELAHLRSIVGLVWRSVVMWMVLLALLTLARLLG
jgi:adenosylcobinamide-phosphate synthase